MKRSSLFAALLSAAVVVGGVSTQSYASEQVTCSADIGKLAINSLGKPLHKRAAPDNKTSGAVPHVQIGAVTDEAVNEDLRELSFALPGVTKKPTIVSLPGALGMWLMEGVDVARPKAIVSGREFAHIHTDGSLHAPLPPERALELVELGWGERHPWADRFDGWEGFVMLFSPRSSEELAVVFQLIVESYNYVTGQSYGASGC